MDGDKISMHPKKNYECKSCFNNMKLFSNYPQHENHALRNQDKIDFIPCYFISRT
jgi:hypothetical protein